MSEYVPARPGPVGQTGEPPRDPGLELAALVRRLEQLEQRLTAPVEVDPAQPPASPAPATPSAPSAAVPAPQPVSQPVSLAVLQGRVKELEAALAAREGQIKTLLVSNVILNSTFLREKTVLPATIALEVFGRIFTVEEVDGTPTAVAHAPDGSPIMSREDPSRLASPDEALELYILQHYPERDAILRASHAGAGAGGNAERQSRTATSIPRNDAKAFAANLEAIARGDVAVR
ncbi:DUF6651 domain-containing protein [Megalodesulfovibrio paquesii]